MNVNEQYLYVLHDELGRIKFGITTNITRRINQITNATGLKIKQVYSEMCFNAPYVEKKLLHYFEDYRIENTEWFTGGLDFVQAVNRAKCFILEVQDYGCE